MPFDAEPSIETTTRDRVIRLRNFLATLPPEKFDMWSIGNPTDAAKMGTCNTPACIGGWGCALFGIPSLFDVADYLGLSDAHQMALFYPSGAGHLNGKPRRMANGTHASKATPQQAVQVLDHYLATGEIDWGVAV